MVREGHQQENSGRVAGKKQRRETAVQQSPLWVQERPGGQGKLAGGRGSRKGGAGDFQPLYCRAWAVADCKASAERTGAEPHRLPGSPRADCGQSYAR